MEQYRLTDNFFKDLFMEEERKKAIVTGGSRGIGRGVALVLVKAGYDVAFSYNTAENEALSLQEEICSIGGRSFLYQVNFENDGTACPFVEQAIVDLGGLDLLVCNAGVTRYNSLLTVDEEFIDRIYNLNYRSYIIMAGAASRHFVDKKVKGNIIFIASTRGIRAYPEDCIYGSLKAALIRAVESMALEMGQYGVRVNCIAPGATAIRGNYTMEELTHSPFTKSIAIPRKGTPAEIGYMVEYLASEKAAYITGDTIKIDGGLILPGPPEKPRTGT